MPPLDNNLPEVAGDGRDDADWARWEQTVRNNRPVLPEAAMARIEASMQRAAARQAAGRPWRLRRRILLLLGAIVGLNVAVLGLMEIGVLHYPSFLPTPAPPTAQPVPLVEDHYPLAVSIGPNLTAPDAPIMRFDANSDWAKGTGKWQAVTLPTTRPSDVELAMAAEHLPMDGHRALGLMELRRVAGVVGPRPPLFAPEINQFWIGTCWRMLPLNPDRVAEFNTNLGQVNPWKAANPNDPAARDVLFWTALLGSSGLNPTTVQGGVPREFPGHAADRARFDVLTELGFTKAQAALDVLTTRSYEPVMSMEPLRGSEACNTLLAATRDVVERAFVLRLLNRDAEAHELLQAAGKIGYLNKPQDMAVLLARLGPDEAWDKALRPLMEDECSFVNDPPGLSQNTPHQTPEAIVQATTKNVDGGVTHYDGTAILITAGPWRITCHKLAVYRIPTGGVLLSTSGAVNMHGVLKFSVISADEMTLNTETGEAKLSGHVRLNGWSQQQRDVQSVTITRSSEVRDEQP